MAIGFVVDHKEAGARYAVAEANFDPKTMTKVRDLKPGETVLGFVPKALPAEDPKPTAPSTEATPTGAAKDNSK